MQIDEQIKPCVHPHVCGEICRDRAVTALGCRLIEFFTAHIRNRNTRAAYARATARFARWCDVRGIALTQLTPVIVAAYIEELGQLEARPTVKQHVAALRVLSDYLVTG